MRIKRKYEKLIFVSIMVFIMTCFISLINTFIGKGINGFELTAWLKTWALSYAIAFPIAYVTVSILRKYLSRIFVD